MSEMRPIYPIHPGEILADELQELDMTASQVARELHVPANRLYQILAGKRALTADTALRLEQWLGVTAAFWLNLQTAYELDLATQQVGRRRELCGLFEMPRHDAGSRSTMDESSVGFARCRFG